MGTSKKDRIKRYFHGLFYGECFACNYIRKYFYIFIFIFFCFLLVFSFNMIGVMKSYAYYVNAQMNYNIYEYNEINLEQLCRISVCKYIYTEEINDEFLSYYKIFVTRPDKSQRIRITRDATSPRPKLKNIFENYYIDDHYNIILHNETSNAYFALNLDKFIQETKGTYIISFSLVYFIVFLIQFLIHKKQQHEQLLQTYGTEAILSNQSMILITENVNHELNTPLEVIDNKLEKIKRTIQDYVLEEYKEFENTPGAVLTPERIKINNRMIKLNKDFEFVHTALEQVFGVLERMRGFKHLKYSNGNKTLFDIAEGACQIISIRNSGFDFIISEELKNYKLPHKHSKDLKNVDLLNIIINHLKNSLEAKSSEIRIEISEFDKNKIKLNIIDNGNGIPEHFVDEVFVPNFSTKVTQGSVRGNGMYLNKYILNTSGGDVIILDSNENGTIVQLTFPCVYQEYIKTY